MFSIYRVWHLWFKVHFAAPPFTWRLSSPYDYTKGTSDQAALNTALTNQRRGWTDPLNGSYCVWKLSVVCCFFFPHVFFFFVFFNVFNLFPGRVLRLRQRRLARPHRCLWDHHDAAARSVAILSGRFFFHFHLFLFTYFHPSFCAFLSAKILLNQKKKNKTKKNCAPLPPPAGRVWVHQQQEETEEEGLQELRGRERQALPGDFHCVDLLSVNTVDIT